VLVNDLGQEVKASRRGRRGSWYAHNLYQLKLGFAIEPGTTFRRTEDLRTFVWKGCEIRSNYSDLIFVVDKVWRLRSRIPAEGFRTAVTFSITAHEKREGGSSKSGFNEYVLVDGRILKLFSNSEDELFVLRRVPRQGELFELG